MTLSILIFLALGAAFLMANLIAGKLVRPNRPSAEKGEVYECGEVPIGTAWIRFDLRFYVVALLFVVFDVELAFFFPWAVVFGSANRMANEALPADARLEAARQIDPSAMAPLDPLAAASFGQFAFLEMLVFFAILLVGFAYLWRRGDLEWVRSTAGQPAAGGAE